MTKIVRSGLEVYKTKDSNKEEITKKEDSEGFVFQNGTATEISYYADMYENSFEYDYEDISSNAQVSFPNVDSSKFYKGKRVCLKKAYNPKKWGDLKNCLTGFITEQTYSMDKVELKISGMTKLLEKKHEFNFTKTKRSIVVKKIIETAGLKANVNVKGLKDDVIDYTNVSNNDSSNVSGDIAETAHKICKNSTTELEKAKAIWKWCHDNIKYEKYSNSKKGAEKCFSDKAGNCCDHANVVVTMLKAENIKCAYEHSSSCYGSGHVWAVAFCEGKWYRIDASVKSRGFNQVGNGCTGTRKESLGF